MKPTTDKKPLFTPEQKEAIKKELETHSDELTQEVENALIKRGVSSLWAKVITILIGAIAAALIAFFFSGCNGGYTYTISRDGIIVRPVSRGEVIIMENK